MGLLEEARLEVSQKTLKEIERETAWKWAARAVAAYELWVGGNRAMYHDACTYLGEALEHSVFADETGETLQAVRAWVHQYIPRGVL
jgi:hypothetical protein